MVAWDQKEDWRGNAMRTTTIINGKGGVGKTTTAHALATGLNRTLVSDGKTYMNEKGNEQKNISGRRISTVTKCWP